MDKKVCFLIADTYYTKKLYKSQQLERRIEEKLRFLLEEREIGQFVTCLNKELDLTICTIALRLISDYADKDVTLKCVLRYDDFEMYWSENRKNEFHRIISNCSEKIVLDESYKASSGVWRQNELCVQEAELVFAVNKQNRSGGNTKRTIRYAQEMQKEVVILDTSRFYGNVKEKPNDYMMDFTLSVSRRQDRKWSVTECGNDTGKVVAITDFQKEAEKISREGINAMIDGRYTGWLEKRQVVQYCERMRQWFLLIPIGRNQYSIGFVCKYVRIEELYYEVMDFINIKQHNEIEFVNTYRSWIEKFQIMQLKYQVECGDIFKATGKGMLTATLVHGHVKYQFGQMNARSAGEFQKMLLMRLNKGMDAFKKWYDRCYLRANIDEKIFTLIGQKISDERIADFARQCMDNADVSRANRNTYVITRGTDTVLIKCVVNDLGIICLPTIEHVSSS